MIVWVTGVLPERLLLATNVSTTCAEVIFRVKSLDSEDVCYSWVRTIFLAILILHVLFLKYAYS